VDVRRLRLAVRAHLREETLEEQAVTHGIDRRDAEAVRNRTVRRAAAPLAENAARAREADRVPHHEEEPRKDEIADDAQLVLDLHALPRVRLAPTLSCTCQGTFREERVVIVTVGNVELRQRRAQPAQIQRGTAVPNVAGKTEPGLPALPQGCHITLRFKSPF